MTASKISFVLVMFAGWVNRHQLDVIEYLQEENRVLKERLGGRRIRFTDPERRLLARKARALGRKVLNGTSLKPRLRRTRFCAGTGTRYVQVELQPPARPGPSARHENNRRLHAANGA
jgi:hypothetical protein